MFSKYEVQQPALSPIGFQILLNQKISLGGVASSWIFHPSWANSKDCPSSFLADILAAKSGYNFLFM